MARNVGVGDEAPNFDLTSTDDVVLMLCDEVPRTPVVLYFFAAPSEDRSRHDLIALSRHAATLAERRAVILAVSPAPLDELKEVQRDLKLPFALLHDDRGFSTDYGAAAPSDESVPPPVLALVGRDQKVLWLGQPTGELDDALAQIEKLIGTLATSSESYPRKVINRLVDRWVH